MWFLNIPVLRQGNVMEMMPRARLNLSGWRSSKLAAAFAR
jgi:hypothetical protein